MWSGDLFIGNCFALYTGEADTNDFHHHVTYQLVICRQGNVHVFDHANNEVIAKTVLIKPLTGHSIQSNFPLTIIYIEPQSDLAFKLFKTSSLQSIASIDQNELAVDLFLSHKQLIQSLSLLAPKPSQSIDKRVLLAMQVLCEKPAETSIVEAAKACNLSESRLRTIAREQLGVPLATWHLWCKLQKSVTQLQGGAKLLDAAISGGFSDQAHFNRTMRRMFGVSPSTAMNLLR